jgi:hypothetical protein
MKSWGHVLFSFLVTGPYVLSELEGFFSVFKEPASGIYPEPNEADFLVRDVTVVHTASSLISCSYVRVLIMAISERVFAVQSNCGG